MSKEAIYQKIVEFILNNKGADYPVTPETSIENSVSGDSVEVMEFVLNLEDEFHVEIPDSAIEDFQTLSDVVDYIYEYKQ